MSTKPRRQINGRSITYKRFVLQRLRQTDLKNTPEAPTAPFNLLALVDPFNLKDISWPDIRDGLSRFMPNKGYTIVEIFTFEKREVVEWPDGPNPCKYPVAVLDKNPYHLAVYCSENIKPEVIGECERLGWRKK